MEPYQICWDLALILAATKLFAILARKCKAPQVVGQIIAGLIIGPSIFNLVSQSDELAILAEVGVVLLMFSAGLETDLKELIRTGPIAVSIACVGVVVPLIGGTLLYLCYYGFETFGSEQFLTAMYIGTIMTATSVSITVEALRELGHLKGKIGTIILSSAIIDDVIGIIVLTIVIGFKDPSNNPINVVISTVLFFVVAIIVGIIIYQILKRLERRYARMRRFTILALAICFMFAYTAEKVFGIADITGAYVAGIILSNMKQSKFIEGKVEIDSYTIFGPAFFASIGLKTDISSMTSSILLFSVLFVIVALMTKIIGCGLIARLFRFNFRDSLKIGVGMMTRGEVALIVAQKGLSAGIISSVYFTSVIMLIIVSSIGTPVLLKLLYAKEDAVRWATHD